MRRQREPITAPDCPDQAACQELQTLFKVAGILAGAGSFDQQVASVLREVLMISEADAAHLRVPDEAAQGLRLVSSVGLGVEERAQEPVRRYGESRSGEAFQLGEPIIANDYGVARRAGPRFAKDAIEGFGARSATWLPIKSSGRPIGVMSVSTRKADHFTPDRVRLLTAIADGMGTFLERARLEEEGGHREAELSATLARLQVTQQQLVQSGKLAAMGELVAGVAHEINNPLASILGYAQLLLRSEVDAKDRERLERVLAETKRVARIVQNLLSFARQQKPKWEPFCANEALMRVMELRGYDLKIKNIELVMDIDPGLQLVLGDPQQLEQVFLNIVNNALRAMATAHQHGRLEVKTRGLENRVRITFADDGPGIPAGIVDRVFDPFFTTTEPGEGTGLGLSICYGIVQEHGGRIAMKSAPQGGCVVEVELPLAETEPACDRALDGTATPAA